MNPTNDYFRHGLGLAAASALLASAPAFAIYNGAMQYVQNQTLYSTPDELADSGFGYAVAVSGDRIAVSSRTPCPPPATGICGRVSLLFNVAGQWTPEAALTPPAGVTNFGTSIGLDGDWLIVGATGGAGVFLYQRMQSGSTVTWAPVPLDTSSVNSGNLGTSVAISAAGIAVAGAPEYADAADFPVGAVATFVRSAATGVWSVEGVFLGEYDSGAFGQAISLYTYRLGAAVNGYGLAVGAPAASALSADPQEGSGYILTRGTSDIAWTQRARYELGSGGHPQEHLGASVSLYGGTIVWGIPRRQIANGNRPGSAYVVRRNTTDWTNYTGTEIPSPDTTDQALYGTSVAINGNTLFVGAPVPASFDGEVFQFDYVDGLSGKIWEINSDSPLQAQGPFGAGDDFGASAAFDGTTAVFDADASEIPDGGGAFSVSVGAAFVFLKDRIFTDGFDGT
jgi:hypothetical protein